MLSRLFFLLFSLFSIHSFAIDSYFSGDSLYIWAKRGLSLRKVPNLNAERIAVLPFGTCVVAQSSKFSNSEDSVEVEELNAVIDQRGKALPAYLIKGSWVKVRANGKEGYVFDGYLSTLAPFDSKSTLLKKFSQKSIGYKQMIIYTNGVCYHERGYEGGNVIKYILPDATIEEGFLVSNHLFEIERMYAAALKDKNGQIGMSFGKDRFWYEFEYEVEGSYVLSSISISEVDNTIIIVSINAD
jgi:hypothetical protein